MSPEPIRYVVVGTSGAGKSSLARTLSQIHRVPHIELDALHWDPGWTEVEPAVLCARVDQALAAPGWVVDGNYAMVRDRIWPRANLVIWLDLPLPVVLWRVVTRTLRRSWTGQTLWNGNREDWRKSFLSRDSVILWALTTFSRRRAEYARLFVSAHERAPRMIRLRSSAEVARWVADQVPVTR